IRTWVRFGETCTCILYFSLHLHDGTTGVNSYPRDRKNTHERLKAPPLPTLTSVSPFPAGQAREVGIRREDERSPLKEKKIATCQRIDRGPPPSFLRATGWILDPRFVSQLALPPGQEKLLLSGSGDGTLRLWRYETGQELQSCRISSVQRPKDPEDDAQKIKRFAISRICCSPNGEHVAVLCDGIAGIFLFSLSSSAPLLAYPQYIALPYVPMDLDFEDVASLWGVISPKRKPIELLQYRERTCSWCRYMTM
ncbi:tRNA (guanine-N(7)-)-methyltransferase non-catalytic subunit wdr4-like, partial [Dendropsophus ebraccatus]|uniref:tRNA (guanine-N(7)-)-methyltransferase non-catalytic subunit wdr4-like n=1 Tax=Dendropsophus ebraccatus TaxID=150705 RepID=UPI003831EFD5